MPFHTKAQRKKRVGQLKRVGKTVVKKTGLAALTPLVEASKRANPLGGLTTVRRRLEEEARMRRRRSPNPRGVGRR